MKITSLRKLRTFGRIPGNGLTRQQDGKFLTDEFIASSIVMKENCIMQKLGFPIRE